MDENLKLPQPDSVEASRKRWIAPFWHNLSWSVVLSFVLVAVLPLAVVMALAVFRIRTAATNQAVRQLAGVAELKRDSISQWLVESDRALNLFLADPARQGRLIALVTSAGLGQSDLKPVDDLLSDAVRAQPLFKELFVYTVEGQVVASSNPLRLENNVDQLPFFTRSVAGDHVQVAYYSEVLIAKTGGEVARQELNIVVTYPLIDFRSGQPVGVLAARLDRGRLDEIMTMLAGLGDTGETYLVSPNNYFMVTPSRFAREGYEPAQAYHTEGIERAVQAEEGTGIYPNYRREPARVIGLYRWIPELQLALLAEIEEAEVVTPFVLSDYLIVGLGVVMLLLVVGAGLFIAARIARPLASLTRFVSSLAEGELLAANTLQPSLPRLDEIRRLAVALNTLVERWRQRVDSFEERIRQHSQRLEVVAGLGEQLSTFPDLEGLLRNVVNQVTESLGHYHAHIYMADKTRENLVIAVGAGEAGLKMKAAGHHIALDSPVSLVARAFRSAQIIKVDDVTMAPDWLPNPLLPGTQAEMAVPIVAAGQVVGVLDVQENRVAGLDESDTNLLRSLANQIGVVIANIRLMDETRTALAQVETLNRQLTRTDWQDVGLKVDPAGYVFTRSGTAPTRHEWLPAMGPAIQYRNLAYGEVLATKAEGEVLATKAEGEVLAAKAEGEDGSSSPSGKGGSAGPVNSLAIPLTLRGEIIGVIGIERPAAESASEPGRAGVEWTEDELITLQTVTEQVALALDSARLARETERSAWRDRIVSETTARVWSSGEVEEVMRSAVVQLGSKLQASEVVIRLGTETILVHSADHP